MSKIIREALLSYFEGDEEAALAAAAEVYHLKKPTWEGFEHGLMAEQRRASVRRFNKVMKPGEEQMLSPVTSWTEFNRCVLDEINFGSSNSLKIFPRPMKRNPKLN